MGRFEFHISHDLTFSPPIMPASGTFGYGDEMADNFDYSSIGAIVTKGISLYPRKGNPFPRVVEVNSGMLNSIGLENIGLEKFLKSKIPFYRKLRKPVIANVFGESPEEFSEIVERMNNYSEISGFELNLSCPNVKKGGVEFAREPEIVRKILADCRGKTEKFISLKLSIHSDYLKLSHLARDEGIDAVTLINTVKGMDIDIYTFRSRLGTTFGGLSGPAIKPIALKVVYEVFSSVGIKIIGVGGVSNWVDAVQFFIAGACAIQVGTAFFRNPNVFKEIKEGVEQYLTHTGIHFEQLIGAFKCSG